MPLESVERFRPIGMLRRAIPRSTAMRRHAPPLLPFRRCPWYRYCRRRSAQRHRQRQLLCRHPARPSDATGRRCARFTISGGPLPLHGAIWRRHFVRAAICVAMTACRVGRPWDGSTKLQILSKGRQPTEINLQGERQQPGSADPRAPRWARHHSCRGTGGGHRISCWAR